MHSRLFTCTLRFVSLSVIVDAILQLEAPSSYLELRCTHGFRCVARSSRVRIAHSLAAMRCVNVDIVNGRKDCSRRCRRPCSKHWNVHQRHWTTNPSVGTNAAIDSNTHDPRSSAHHKCGAISAQSVQSSNHFDTTVFELVAVPRLASLLLRSRRDALSRRLPASSPLLQQSIAESRESRRRKYRLVSDAYSGRRRTI
jgi:hypothetical protein